MVKIVVFVRGWVVTLSANFRGMGRPPPTAVVVKKLKSHGYHVALVKTKDPVDLQSFK